MGEIRTDLAMEMHEARRGSQKDIPGVSIEVNHDDMDITITRVRVLDEVGEKQIGKVMGSYITIEAPALREREPALEERVSQCMAMEIRPMMPDEDSGFSALIVGLGNWDITPDALGPRVVSKIMVTRHLLKMIPDQVDQRVRAVCALAPGVLGTTGIETSEVVQGVVKKVQPSMVFIIDALSARNTQRISTTIQISDTGICPGSGIGNQRGELTSASLGVPVVVIGVPMVVYATTIIQDAMQMLMEQEQNVVDGQRTQELLKKIVSERIGELVVTPKEIDIIVEDVSRVLSMGLNLLIHEGVTIDEINRFLH